MSETLGSLHLECRRINFSHICITCLCIRIRLGQFVCDLCFSDSLTALSVHPHHGVIWTDGRAIYLAPLHVDGKHVQNATSVRLGQFDNVTSVHWSCVAEGGEACYLCVVHQNNVTVWRVSGVLPKLAFKQIRKINVRPIAQGCLWNPGNDTLALLSRHQCSFYFRHDDNKGSYALPPLESGKISCGCWSTDGKKLIVSIGSALLIYRWSNINDSVSDFDVAAWRVPSLDGEITSISPMPKNCLVVATELPLESLCRRQDAFTVPDVNGDCQPGDDVIRPSSHTSATDRLMNLQPNAQMMKENSSTLTLIKFQEDTNEPTKISSSPLKGVLTPDILLYEKSSQCVVVGSNSQSQLHIYALLDKHLAYCGDIHLDKSQRPKGLCSMPTYFDERGAALLILVGQRETDDESFLSSSLEAEFQVSLKYIIIKPGYESKSRQQRSRGDSLKSNSMASLRGSNIGKSESMREPRLSLLSTDKQQRTRSGSNALRMNSPVLTTSEASSSSSSSAVEKLPSEALHQVKRAVTHSENPALDILNLSSSQRTNMVQVMPDGSNHPAVSPEELEVEKVSFSSKSAQFNNDKLVKKYELTNKDGIRTNAQNSFTESGKDSRLKNSSRDSSNSCPRSSTSPRPILIKSPSDQIDEHRAQRSVHPALCKSSSDQIFRDGSESPPINIRRLASDQKSSSRDKGKHNDVGDVESRGKLHTNSYENCNGDQVDSYRRKSGSIRHETSDHKVNGARNGKADPQAENHIQGQGHKEDVTSDLGTSADSSFDSMEKQVKNQRSSIEALQRRLEELTSTVEECCCVFPNKYQDMQAPELVEIQCIKGSGVESKKFLLDSGRLQLEPVRLAFQLATVELWLDGVSVVLSSNIDGYIPMKFSSTSVLRVTGQSIDKK